VADGVSRRRKPLAVPARLNVALDVCCEGGPDGPAHTSHRIWRLFVDTFDGAPTPDTWTEWTVMCRPDRDDLHPEPWAGGSIAEQWRDSAGVLWIPADCLVCGRMITVPVRWVLDQLAAVWEPQAQRIVRVVL
jgi:hypothetical protein